MHPRHSVHRWLALVLGVWVVASASGQTPRESLTRAQELFAQGHVFTADEFAALADLQTTLEGLGETELASDLALLRRAASFWSQAQAAKDEAAADLESRSVDWDLRDRRDREKDFWRGVRNVGLTTFVVSTTSFLLLTITTDRDEAIMHNSSWDQFHDMQSFRNGLDWAIGISAGTAFLSLFPLLWGEARQ